MALIKAIWYSVLVVIISVAVAVIVRPHHVGQTIGDFGFRVILSFLPPMQDHESFSPAYAALLANHDANETLPENFLRFHATLRSGHTTNGFIVRPFKKRISNDPTPVVYLIPVGGYAISFPLFIMEHYMPLLDLGVTLISIESRVSPSRFGTIFDDSYDALIWIRDHAKELGIDPKRILVTGASAGAHLTASTVLKTRDTKDLRVLGQVLVYPKLDATPECVNRRSYAKYGGEFPWGYGLPTALIKALIAYTFKDYIPKNSDEKGYHSPVYANLSDLPPTLVIAAQCDPFIDEAREYVDSLRKVNDDVTFVELENDIHAGTMALSFFFKPQKEKFMDSLTQFTKKLLKIN